MIIINARRILASIVMDVPEPVTMSAIPYPASACHQVTINGDLVRCRTLPASASSSLLLALIRSASMVGARSLSRRPEQVGTRGQAYSKEDLGSKSSTTVDLGSV
jgi:hypothetical protein